MLRPAAEAAGIAGPFPADTVFVRAMRGAFDAVIAPYHDVGMTAIKVASFGSAVNVTLGLPFPRYSPDHGTALDIAGKGVADRVEHDRGDCAVCADRQPGARENHGASMSRRFLLVLAMLSVAGRGYAQAAVGARPASVAQRAVDVPANDELVARIVEEGTRRSHVDAGSAVSARRDRASFDRNAGMRRANEWTQQKFREYGMDRAELERFKFGVGWTRGPMTLRMLGPAAT